MWDIADTYERIEATEKLIRPHVRWTPVIEVAAADFGLKMRPLTFKLEFLQHSGSFKARGAFANLLMRDGAERGVVAASGGNHGAAVAYAAMKLGMKARIYVPGLASPAKIERIRSYGAEIIVGGATYVDALRASQEWAAAHDALQVHAYDSPETLLGQATVAVELEREARDLTHVLVAVGGGGLIGGMTAYLRAAEIATVAVEPETAPTLHAALAAGAPVDVPVSGIAADSLGATRIGSLMFPLAQKYKVEAVLVSDAAIREAQRRLWEVLRVVVEPGGAAALAGLLSGAFVPPYFDCRVGILLCGANTGAVDFG